ncbi:MAG: serine hydrolase domain-containing protein [Candidatus Promineifilaceae bacterium]
MRRILALLCLAVLLLSSCQDESEPATPEPSTPEQNMSFSESGTDGAIEASESAVIDPERLAALEDDLEELREILLIPGLSAAVVKDQELVWAKGFGFADLANKIPATPDTPYHLASVTKPIAATVIMQLVEEGLLDLEEPVSDFGVELESEGTINSRHLLTHTSSGVPGTEHHYDGTTHHHNARELR